VVDGLLGWREVTARRASGELTHQIVSAVQFLCRDTIYTLKLRRRGIGLEGPAKAPMGAQHVGAVMEPLPSPLPATTALADAADQLSLSGPPASTSA
jgi:hypothetical protein